MWLHFCKLYGVRVGGEESQLMLSAENNFIALGGGGTILEDLHELLGCEVTQPLTTQPTIFHTRMRAHTYPHLHTHIHHTPCLVL